LVHLALFRPSWIFFSAAFLLRRICTSSYVPVYIIRPSFIPRLCVFQSYFIKTWGLSVFFLDFDIHSTQSHSETLRPPVLLHKTVRVSVFFLDFDILNPQHFLCCGRLLRDLTFGISDQSYSLTSVSRSYIWHFRPVIFLDKCQPILHLAFPTSHIP
jgi:hypothetical protein